MRALKRYEVASDEPAAFEFLNQFFPIYRSSWQKGIVLRRDGEVIAAALYVEFNGVNVFVHLAGLPGRRWLNREFLYWALQYPFVQLGAKRITGWVESTNTDSIRFCEHIGCKREATLSGAGQHGQDVYLYVLYQKDCRYA